jgi:hypothetical protein
MSSVVRISDTSLLCVSDRELPHRSIVPWLVGLGRQHDVIYALERQVEEANAGTAADEALTLHHYIESELVNLITVRDVAELEASEPPSSTGSISFVTDGPGREGDSRRR